MHAELRWCVFPLYSVTCRNRVIASVIRQNPMAESIDLTPDQMRFLGVEWELTRKPRKDGYFLSFGKCDAAMIELHDKLPEDFDPSSIDKRYYERHGGPTLLAIRCLDPDDPILKVATQIIAHIQQKLKSDPEYTPSDAGIAEELSISKWESYLACALMSTTGILPHWSSGSRERHEYRLNYDFARRILSFDSMDNYLDVLQESAPENDDPSHDLKQFAQDRELPAPQSRKVFLVHGHDNSMKESVARFFERLDFEPIILHEQASCGDTIIEKFERHADVSYAVVLLSPDDIGAAKSNADDLQQRARQNVVLELGYFVGRLGRARVCPLVRGTLEVPSDFHGVVYIPFEGEAWKIHLVKELKYLGFEVDANKAF
jgi:predicted nucleotide-binding protein